MRDPLGSASRPFEKGKAMTTRHAAAVMTGILIAVALSGASRGGGGGGGFLEHVWTTQPPSLEDVARRIDHIQEALVNQGTVVIKQPDVWSQARMTKFRQEFEDTMIQELTKFDVYLSGRLARSDFASFRSETSLAGSLTPLSPNTPLQLNSVSEVQAERNTAIGFLTGTQPTQTTTPSGSVAQTPPTAQLQNFSLLSNTTTGKPGDATPSTGMNFGLEPTVGLDERADYIAHLQRLRRINLGDDNSDSAGYGLYLMRVPVSIEPGDKTKKGFGAMVDLTVRHDFGPRFLSATYRNLVINDLIDQLTPVVTELVRNGSAQRYWQAVESRKRQPSTGHTAGNANISPETYDAARRMTRVPSHATAQPTNGREVEAAKATEDAMRTIQQVVGKSSVNRLVQRTYPIAPSDFTRVFLVPNLLVLANAAQVALDLTPRAADGAPPASLKRVRMTEVRAFLRQELESAYGLMEGACPNDPVPVLQDASYMEDLANSVACRQFDGPKSATSAEIEAFNDFDVKYDTLTQRLPGNVRSLPIGALCWAIAVDAGLLNRQLHNDMAETKGNDGFRCPEGVQAMTFYQPQPAPEAELTFQEYVKARWPIITFALEPNVSQQNIEDAFSRRRDLQLAVAFALASGRLSFRQAMQYNRQLQYEAQTISLNQTVASFARDNDTFGWRVSPRFQTPPEESNLRAMTNLLLRGGPGPNYTLNNMKIEPGLREMTAVVVMPSFVRGVRIDAVNNWYRLSDPDERKLHTARSVELGRQINETRAMLDTAVACAHYRTEDVERLRVRLKQLEQMLPLQTSFVKVPYENTQGGFALFTPGVSALVPELSGFEGIDAIPALDRPVDLVLYGKNINIYETVVVVGGRALPREGTGTVVGRDAANKPITVVSSLSPLKDADGSLLMFKADGSAIKVADNGSYAIVSREVVRLRIPANVNPTTRGDGSQVVEIYLATPNGISNKLQVPVAEAGAKAAAAPSVGYTLRTKALTLTYEYDPNPKAPVLTRFVASHPTTIDFALASPALIQPTSVQATFQFKTGSQVAPPISLPSEPVDGGTYKIIGARLGQDPGMMDLARLYLPPPTMPPGATTTKLQVQATIGAGGGIQSGPFSTDDQLAVTFVYSPRTAAATTPAGQLDSQVPPPPIAPYRPSTPAAQEVMPLPRASDDQAPQAETPGPSAARARHDETLRPAAFRPTPAQAPEVLVGDQTMLGTNSFAPPAFRSFPPATAPTTAAPAGPSTPAVTATIPGLPGGAVTTNLLITPGRAPNVNVVVPINNYQRPRLFSRFFQRQPATPQNPTRPPMTERLFGNP